MASEARFLMRQFLEWVAARPRSVREVRQAWGSTCPLTCVREDAIAADLIEYAPEGFVVLTAAGRALLAAQADVVP